jgi:protein TonB
MKIEKYSRYDFETSKTYFLEIGFVCSIAFFLLFLELLTYFSADKPIILSAAEIDMPPVMIKMEDVMAKQLHQNQPAPPEILTPPTVSLDDEFANNIVVIKDKVVDTLVDEKIEIPEDKLAEKDSVKKAEAELEDLTPLMVIDEKPEYPGGTNALLKFMVENIKYPPVAKESGITGVVSISFLVEKDGSVSNVKVVHGLGAGCNEEAIRVVNKMTKWVPGKKHGKPIRTQIQIPIVFYLHGN